jgi:hypothetical protein
VGMHPLASLDHLVLLARLVLGHNLWWVKGKDMEENRYVWAGR